MHVSRYFRVLFPMWRNFSVRRHVKLTRVNKIEAMYERPRVNVKVERGSTFAFTFGLSYIASILFTRVKLTCVRMEKLRDSGNQPLAVKQTTLKLGQRKFLVTTLYFPVRLPTIS